MNTKFCAQCKQEKPYDPSQKPRSKASGFYNKHCWGCAKIFNAERSKAWYQRLVVDPITNETVTAIVALNRRVTVDPMTDLPTTFGALNQRKYRRVDRNRFAGNIRNLVNKAFKNQGYDKTARAAEILGCSFSQLQAHIEAQFTGNMSWDNLGEWHVDHRLPVSAAKNAGEVLLLSHYTNLQPMWKTDNLSKGGKFNEQELQVYFAKFHRCNEM